MISYGDKKNDDETKAKLTSFLRGKLRQCERFSLCRHLIQILIFTTTFCTRFFYFATQQQLFNTRAMAKISKGVRAKISLKENKHLKMFYRNNSKPRTRTIPLEITNSNALSSSQNRKLSSRNKSINETLNILERNNRELYARMC